MQHERVHAPKRQTFNQVASNVASSTKVDIGWVIAFHSSGDFVFARKIPTIINQEADFERF